MWKNRNQEEFLQNEIGSLMDKTYSTQRIDIRYRESFSEVLVKWPCLQDVPFFLKHASTLFGTNQGDIWIREVQSKGPVLFSFFQKKSLKKLKFVKNDRMLENKWKISLTKHT